MSIVSTQLRRAIQQDINEQQADRSALQALYGRVWDTDELQQDFRVHSFLAPYVFVTEKSSGKHGTLMFQHYPRFYFAFERDEREEA